MTDSAHSSPTPVFSTGDSKWVPRSGRLRTPLLVASGQSQVEARMPRTEWRRRAAEPPESAGLRAHCGATPGEHSRCYRLASLGDCVLAARGAEPFLRYTVHAPPVSEGLLDSFQLKILRLRDAEVFSQRPG